jgi:predicted nucleic acid-binding protein
VLSLFDSEVMKAAKKLGKIVLVNVQVAEMTHQLLANLQIANMTR